MEVFAAAIDLLLTDPVLGGDALYRQGDAGPGVPVRVVLARPDRVGSFGETRIASETALLEVRRSEAPTPAEGDSFEVGGERLLIQGEALADAERLLWTIELRPA